MGFLKFLRISDNKEISYFDNCLVRERLVQGGRIIFIDDEEPLLIEELKKEGFSVDHDKSGSDVNAIENQIYDVAIIDYHGVGKRFGERQGLDLLKHIRRVSPRTRLVAYTSRSLNAAESEFFRLSHVVLPKDMGLNDSLIIVEEELRKAFSKEHLFEALIQKANANASDKEKVRKALSKALSLGDESKFKESLIKILGPIGEKAVETIISKLFFNK